MAAASTHEVHVAAQAAEHNTMWQVRECVCIQEFRYGVHGEMNFKESVSGHICFRKNIVRNPENKHLIENVELYQMHFSRISDDTITRSYDQLEIL